MFVHCALKNRFFFPRWLTAWIQREWEEQGLDNVSLATYEFLLSYPDQANPNKIYLVDKDGNQVTINFHTIAGVFLPSLPFCYILSKKASICVWLPSCRVKVSFMRRTLLVFLHFWWIFTHYLRLHCWNPLLVVEVTFQHILCIPAMQT
jgi:hypothetical protein